MGPLAGELGLLVPALTCLVDLLQLARCFAHLLGQHLVVAGLGLQLLALVEVLGLAGGGPGLDRLAPPVRDAEVCLAQLVGDVAGCPRLLTLVPLGHLAQLGVGGSDQVHPLLGLAEGAEGALPVRTGVHAAARRLRADGVAFGRVAVCFPVCGDCPGPVDPVLVEPLVLRVGHRSQPLGPLGPLLGLCQLAAQLGAAVLAESGDAAGDVADVAEHLFCPGTPVGAFLGLLPLGFGEFVSCLGLADVREHVDVQGGFGLLARRFLCCGPFGPLPGCGLLGFGHALGLDLVQLGHERVRGRLLVRLGELAEVVHVPGGHLAEFVHVPLGRLPELGHVPLSCLAQLFERGLLHLLGLHQLVDLLVVLVNGGLDLLLALPGLGLLDLLQLLLQPPVQDGCAAVGVVQCPAPGDRLEHQLGVAALVGDVTGEPHERAVALFAAQLLVAVLAVRLEQDGAVALLGVLTSQVLPDSAPLGQRSLVLQLLAGDGVCGPVGGVVVQHSGEHAHAVGGADRGARDRCSGALGHPGRSGFLGLGREDDVRPVLLAAAAEADVQGVAGGLLVHEHPGGALGGALDRVVGARVCQLDVLAHVGGGQVHAVAVLELHQQGALVTDPDDLGGVAVGGDAFPGLADDVAVDLP